MVFSSDMSMRMRRSRSVRRATWQHHFHRRQTDYDGCPEQRSRHRVVVIGSAKTVYRYSDFFVKNCPVARTGDNKISANRQEIETLPVEVLSFQVDNESTARVIDIVSSATSDEIGPVDHHPSLRLIIASTMTVQALDAEFHRRKLHQESKSFVNIEVFAVGHATEKACRQCKWLQKLQRLQRIMELLQPLLSYIQKS